MEKGVKQGKGSYPLLSMKKDQANKTNVERVYRWRPLVWEPGPNGSGIDLWLVWEWVWHSHTSCASMHRSWSRAEAEEAGGGRWGQRWLEVGREWEGRSYHDTELCGGDKEKHLNQLKSLPASCFTFALTFISTSRMSTLHPMGDLW